MHSALRPHGDGLQGSITSIGRGVAKKTKLEKPFLPLKTLKLTAWSVTLSKRISYESLVASTLRNMVPDSAVGVHTTEARTGVLALSVDASSVCGAVSIDHTLRAAIGW